MVAHSVLYHKSQIYFLEIITCDPSLASVYIMDQCDFIICSFMENSIHLKRVNGQQLITLLKCAVRLSHGLHVAHTLDSSKVARSFSSFISNLVKEPLDNNNFFLVLIYV